MDKATTALVATEDNAAAIRALSKSLRSQIESITSAIAELEGKIGSGGGSPSDIEAIRSKTEQNAAEIDGLYVKIKTNSTAISELNSAVNNNTAAIDELSGTLATNTAAVKKVENNIAELTTNRLIASKTTVGQITFGAIASDGRVCVIITFEGTGRRTVVYGNTSLGSMYSPAVFVLPKGNTNLVMSGTAPANALVLSGTTIDM